MIRTVTRHVIVCSLCGGTREPDGEEYAFDSPEAAQDHIRSTAGDTIGWSETADGRHICDYTDDTAHRDAHASAGRVGRDAMDVNYGQCMTCYTPGRAPYCNDQCAEADMRESKLAYPRPAAT